MFAQLALSGAKAASSRAAPAGRSPAAPCAPAAAAAPSCSGRGVSEPAARTAGAALRRPARGRSVAARAAGRAAALSAGEIVEVEELKGIRVVPSAEDARRPTVEYLVKWKDGSPDTWCVRGSGASARGAGAFEPSAAGHAASVGFRSQGLPEPPPLSTE